MAKADQVSSIDAALTSNSATTDDGGMRDVTPRQVGAAAAAQRSTPLSSGTPFEHEDTKLISIVYRGRKNKNGRVSRRSPQGEHIDVTAPGPENEDAVADYESGISVQNVPEDQRDAVGLGLLTPEYLHADGRHYHFEQGRVNHRVHPDDEKFLLDHEAYKFVRVERKS